MTKDVLYVKVFLEGETTGFSIIYNEGQFEVEQNGKLIATIQHNGHWQQKSGERLNDYVFTTICCAIESY